MADLQKALNDVYAFLKAQGSCSFDEKRGCRYRDSKGRKCAAGFFIPDDKYNPDMEGVSASSVKRDYRASNLFDGLPWDFLDECQCAHDNCVGLSDFQSALRYRFGQVALQFNLTLAE